MDQENKYTSLRDLWEENKKRNNHLDFESCVHLSINIKYLYLNHFDWLKYLETYNDIVLDQHNEFNAYKHWIEKGIKENRCAGKKYSQEPFGRFEWQSYLEMNSDLEVLKDDSVDMQTELNLYDHWISHGKNENRPVTQVENINESTNTIEEITIKEQCNIFVDDHINKEWFWLMQSYLEEINWKQYLSLYSDLKNAQIVTNLQAFIHWVTHGKDEGRIGKTVSERDNETRQKIQEQTIERINEKYKSGIMQVKNVEDIPSFIVNMEPRIDRKIETQYQLDLLKINNYEFFKAFGKEDAEVKTTYSKYLKDYDNGQVSRTFYDAKTEYQIINSIGAIGLIKSTIELFKKIESKNLDYVLILEDDVCLHYSWHYILKPIKNCMFHDLIYVGYNNYRNEINDILNNDQSTVIRTIPSDRTMGSFYGTYGYICNSKFRKTIIDCGISWFTKNNATLDYGFNILNWQEKVDVAVVTGQPLIYPKINDPEAINKGRVDPDNFYKIRNINTDNYIPPVTTNHKFVFIVPSYNNEKWIDWNIKSMMNQSYTNWRMIYINDCSTDATHDKFSELTKERNNKITYLKNEKKYGQAFNRYLAYNMCDDDEYCVMLDGDDWLYHNYVLQYISLFLFINNVELTYGSYFTFENGNVTPKGYNPGDYPKKITEDKTYRNDIWRACHLRVMKAEYLKKISPLDFLDDKNNIIPSSTDMVESYACLELSDGKHKKVNETLMVYNKDNSLMHPTSYYNSTNTAYKKKILERVKSISPYQKKIQFNKVAIIDIDKPNYKKMGKLYKKNMIRKMDLFLVRGNIIHYYISKLNKYKEIIYLTDITNDDNDTFNQEEQEEEDNSEKIILNESNIVDVDVNEILDNSNALVNDIEETRESEENHLVYSG